MNTFNLSEEHYNWFLAVHKKHMAAMGSDNQRKYALENIQNIRYDETEDTVNVYYEDIWWHYDRDSTWY